MQNQGVSFNRRSKLSVSINRRTQKNRSQKIGASVWYLVRRLRRQKKKILTDVKDRHRNQNKTRPVRSDRLTLTDEGFLLAMRPKCAQ